MNGEEEELSGIEKRKADAIIFQQSKKLCLQDDEISRLQSEYQTLQSQIKSSMQQQNVVDIYKRKIGKIKRKIASIPSKVSLARSKIVSFYSDEINILMKNHSEELEKIQILYQQKIQAIISQTYQVDSISEDISKSIELTKKQINDVMEKSINEKENRISERLNRIAKQIENYNQREKDLLKMIEEQKAKLKEAKEFSSLKKYDAQSTFQNQEKIFQVSKTKAEEKVLAFRATMINEENAYCLENQNILDSIQNQINEKIRRTLELQKLIRENKDDQNENLKIAQKKLELLLKEQEELFLEDINRSETENKTLFQEKDHQELYKIKIAQSISKLLNVKIEHQSLLDELKRLDFMIYGRAGKYQHQERLP